ncbi:Myb DNA-bind 5 domain-containing protein, partial [Aphis craccivora]
KSLSVQHYKTGGGKNPSTLSDVTQKVIGLLGDRMDPLLNNVDCDADYNANITFLSGDQIIVEEISGDELSFHCSNIQHGNMYLHQYSIFTKKFHKQ